MNQSDKILYELLTEGMEDLHDKDRPCILLSTFILSLRVCRQILFSGTRSNRLTLAQMRGNKLQQIIDQFISIIQSGKTVSILTLYAFIPPVWYR